jgi:Spy/CpxP family protein refolding chaperone
MKIFKWKLAASCALLGLCTLALHAQSDAPQGPPPGDGPHGQWRGGRGGGPERQLAMLTHRLNLTAEQQTGVKALLEQQATQMMALRTKTPSESATPPTPEARAAERKQMDAIRDETDTKITALLNDDQKKTFSDMVAQRKAAMARREAGGDAPPPPPPPPGEDR